jgi:GNAT superfamily N-acetyltransferase
LTRYYAAHRAQLSKLALQVKHRIISGMGQQQPDADGVTFQVEPFCQFYADAEPLFREHLTQTDQSPEDHARKNLPLLTALDDRGALQCLTARSNGRMFGYLMSVIVPSLDSPDVIQAEHTIFYASPDIRNLGMKLQRAAVDALRARGVNEVIMRAGHRGSGPRLGTFYRRLGAEEFGQLYKLKLEELA